MKNNLILKKTIWSILYRFIRYRLFYLLSKDALPVFIRGGDIISAGPIINGSHDPHVNEILKIFSSEGYNDFLIDIGANIGLTTSSVGNSFKKVILFEPNSLCLGILETNVAISLLNVPYEIRRYGLGNKSGKVLMKIPRNNWGGAYVVSDENLYSSQTLMDKDNYNQENLNEYLTLEIEIRDGESEFQNLFSELMSSGNINGSIKIDVEGFEYVILKSIIALMPDEMGFSIIFENWSDDFPFEELLNIIDGRAELFVLDKTPKADISHFKKLFSLIFNGGEDYKLIPWRKGVVARDLVLKTKLVKI
jgi:FkbM family methyltransferase